MNASGAEDGVDSFCRVRALAAVPIGILFSSPSEDGEVVACAKFPSSERRRN